MRQHNPRDPTTATVAFAVGGPWGCPGIGSQEGRCERGDDSGSIVQTAVALWLPVDEVARR